MMGAHGAHTQPVALSVVIGDMIIVHIITLTVSITICIVIAVAGVAGVIFIIAVISSCVNGI